MNPARAPALFLAMAATSAAVLLISLKSGAFPVSWADLLGSGDSTGQRVFRVMRLPRALLGFFCGGALGVCGAALQGLFRNPLADPALVGVSAGAAMGAVLGIVIIGPLVAYSVILLPLCAFCGALLATLALLAIAREGGRISTLLLAGIAVNALSGAGIGWLVYGASDSQLRDFTFWSLGSIAGAGWTAVLAVVPLVVLAAVLLIRRAGALNALALGESDAWHMGAPVGATKRAVLAATALAVGAATAFTGMIGFIGLVAPHLVRRFVGADHRLVLPASFLIGGSLLCAADTVARVARAPAEIPVGIVVASLGAPFFALLIMRGKGLGI